MLMAVKFVEGSADTIEGLILPYGGPMGGKDLTGTFFTKETDFCFDWFPDGGRPGLYRHGFDPTTKQDVIGREIGGRDDDKGHWLQAQLDASYAYAEQIKELVRQGKLFLSSGAVDHLTDVKEVTGEIRRWPWVEWSLTPKPANPDQPAVREHGRVLPGYAVKSLDAAAHLAVLGIAVPAAMQEAAPPATKDYSDAAWDAAQGALALNTVLQLISDEADEPEQVAMLQRAADALTEWIGAERAEIGTPADGAFLEVHAAVREGRRNSTSDASLLGAAHDNIATVLGMDCMPEGATKSLDVEPPRGLAIKTSTGPAPMSDEAVAQLAERLRHVAVTTAREALGR